MNICIFGNKKSTRRLIESLVGYQIEINSIVILDANAFNKIDISGGDDNLADFVSKLGIECFRVQNYSLISIDEMDFFKRKKFDIGLCTGWQRIIPDAILNQFRFGVFGWHGSGFKFPNGRGRSPINWSIRLGLSVVFHNCFKYEVGVDSGSVYETIELEILPSDYISDVQEKAFQHILNSSRRLISDIRDNSLKLFDQIDHPYISFPKLSDESGRLDPLQLDCNDAVNIIRSCSKPFPGAFIYLNDLSKKIRIWKCQVSKDINMKEGFGDVNIKFHDGSLWIKFRDGGIIKSNEYSVDIV